MNLSNDRIVPISEARSKLSLLLDKTRGDEYFLLTRGGKIKAALVDIDYLEKLEEDLNKLFGKTYIDPKVLPLTRKFSDKEVKEWLKEDQL